MKGRTVALAAMALAGLIVARRLSAPRRMPYRTLYQRALAERRGEEEAARLVARAQSRYDEMYAQRPQPANRALRFHVERGILPGLALYQTLLEESDDRQAVLAEMEHLLAAALASGMRLMSLLSRLPDPFAALRWAEPRLLRFGLPAEGWQIEPVDDSESCIGFDVRRCFYLDTLHAYGAPELTRAFCGMDDVLFEALRPSITWERTMTLGRGHERCDFRWCRAAPEGTASGARER